jgi:antitoxin component of MazEF toxin-antitoxin module
MITVTVRRWGNGLGIRLPARVIRALALTEGSAATLSVESGVLRIWPVTDHRMRRPWSFYLQRAKTAGVAKLIEATEILPSNQPRGGERLRG